MTIEAYFKTRAIDMEKDTKRKGKRIRYVLLILCLSLIVFSLYTLLNWYLDHSKIRQISTEIDKSIVIKEKQEQGELVNPPQDKSSNYYQYIKVPYYEVSLSILSTKNSDTVGFLRLRNTKINYPVVQTTDNAYYLNHSFDKSENDAGWIFMDYRNRVDTLQDNTILYGHARLDGTLFGSLKDTLSSSWQKDLDNYVIFLSTQKENMVFQIFSIYTIQKESYYITTTFKSKMQKQIWLNTMKERNTSSIDTDVNVNDKVLTLSTCQDNQGGRVVVHAKLIKKQKKG